MTILTSTILILCCISSDSISAFVLSESASWLTRRPNAETTKRGDPETSNTVLTSAMTGFTTTSPSTGAAAGDVATTTAAARTGSGADSSASSATAADSATAAKTAKTATIAAEAASTPVPNFRPAAGLRRVCRCGAPPDGYPALLRRLREELAMADADGDEEEECGEGTTSTMKVRTQLLIVDLRGREESLPSESPSESPDCNRTASEEGDQREREVSVRTEKVDLVRTAVRSIAAQVGGAGRTKDKIQPFIREINRDGLFVFYRALLEHAGDDLGRVLRLVTEHLEGGGDDENDEAYVVVHCTQGKDRTGIVAMLLQAAARTDTATGSECDGDDLIVSDFAKSQNTLTQEMIDATNGVGMSDGVDMKIMASADPATMRQTLDWIRRENGGSIHGYLDRIGFDEEWRARFRKTQH